MKNPIKTFLKCPKKYLTIIGGLFAFIAVGTVSSNSVTAVYFMSYMHIKLKSNAARLPNTIYLTTFTQITNSLSAIISGILLSKYKFSLKKMYILGSVTIRFILFNNHDKVLDVNHSVCF